MNRTASVAAFAGLLGLGVLAAGLVDSWPESVRGPAALVLLLALPAYLIARVTPARLPLPDDRPALRLVVAFLLWLCLLSLWITCFAIAGASFRTCALATLWMLLAFFATCAFVLMRRRDVEPPAAARKWWILVGICALFAAATAPELGVSGDGLDHVGYVRRVLLENALRPGGVLSLPGGEVDGLPDPRKGTLHAAVAVASWISSSDPAVTWRWLGVVLFPAALLALVAFNAAFLASRAARLAAAALVLLFFGGNMFRFAAASTNGANLAALWPWAMTALAVATPSGNIRWHHWMLLSAGGVLVHLGVAWHVLVLAASIAAFGSAWGIGARERARHVVSLVAGVVLALLVRRADLAGETNIIHAHIQGVMFVSERFFVASPMEILRQHGIVLLGGLVCIPALLVRARGESRSVLAAAAIPLAVSFLPWIATFLYGHGSYMVFRSLLQVPVFAAIVMCAAALLRGVRRRDRVALLVGVPAAMLWMAVFVRPVPGALMGDVRARTLIGRSGEMPRSIRALIGMMADLPSGAVVLSDPATSYVLSAHTSQRFVTVYQQHGTPRDPLALERVQAARDVLSPYVVPETAVAACRRFGVNYVIVNGAPPGDASDFLSVWRAATYPVTLMRMRSMGASFTLVDSSSQAVVFRFNPRAGIARGWSAQDQPVVVGAPPLAPCSIEAPGRDFWITGVAVTPERALPGDIVQVTLGYDHDTITRFMLPSVVHVRFDHEVLAQTGDYPGAKQWRRFADGRASVRSRFRADLRPGHGVYEPDLWPVGFDLFETFTVEIPRTARHGEYRVEVSIEPETLLPNFHVRDLLFNRDHYSGSPCASLTVAGHVTGGEVRP